jgi:hypothetical protein
MDGKARTSKTGPGTSKRVAFGAPQPRRPKGNQRAWPHSLGSFETSRHGTARAVRSVDGGVGSGDWSAGKLAAGEKPRGTRRRLRVPTSVVVTLLVALLSVWVALAGPSRRRVRVWVCQTSSDPRIIAILQAEPSAVGPTDDAEKLRG